MDPRLRDILLFCVGVLLLTHQVIFSRQRTPEFVGAAFAMMLGSPVLYRYLNRANGSSKGDDK